MIYCAADPRGNHWLYDGVYYLMCNVISWVVPKSSISVSSNSFVRAKSPIRRERGHSILGALILAAFTGLLALSQTAVAQAPTGDAQQRLNALLSKLESERVEQVEVLYIPTNILTNTAITAEMLRSGYSYMLTMPRFSNSRQAAPLKAALKRTTVRGTTGTADLRWGVHFTLVGGTSHRLYMDGFGRMGQIDDLPVTFQGGLYEWLQSFATCMK